MIGVGEALVHVLHDLRLLDSQPVALTDAAGRVLGQDVVSDRDVPSFRNSAMDGYAVWAGDTTATPVRLRVLEVVGAGSVPSTAVSSGTATQIMTGSVMPDGADAVVKVEDTEAGADGHVVIRRVVLAGENVRLPGEDVRTGDVVLRNGRQLRPADVGLLASLGCARVTVRRQPVVAILATGDELVDINQPLTPGKIVNSNAYTLAAAVREAGGIPKVFDIVPDTHEALRAAFGEALAADMVLSTGGVSMGVFDLVRETLASLHVEERFWKVAQKPGKPLLFGVRGSTPVFGLPGNPVSSLVCFYVYVRPALRKMLGLSQLHLPVVDATADEDISVAQSMTEFVRCTLSGAPGTYGVRVTGTQSSGVLRSMSLGEALLISPAGHGSIKRGDSTRVMLIGEQPETRCRSDRMDYRIGHGHDIHRIVDGRPLILGGVQIDAPFGLLGHSDGDAVLHAICDAILGAIGHGDIGRLFPDTDERYRGANSADLLGKVVTLMRDASLRIGNVDVTVSAERPRLAPHREAICARIAELLGAEVGTINLKAKTNEGLDAIGRGEAIAATAVVLLVPDQ